VNPIELEIYFCILRNSLQIKVVPKSTKIPENPTRQNLMNFRMKASLKIC
jgi:hypothetical protein